MYLYSINADGNLLGFFYFSRCGNTRIQCIYHVGIFYTENMQNASGNDKRNFDIFACSSSTNVSCPLGVIHIEKKIVNVS